MSEKGEGIRLVGGTYKDKTGWLNAAKKHTPLCYYVIVALDNEEKATRVRKTSVKLGSAEAEPTSYEEACLQQHPDIDAAFDKLVQDLVKCGIHGDSQEILRIITKKLTEARVAQSMKGNKAIWRNVNWEGGDL
jgi:hypothetical protein